MNTATPPITVDTTIARGTLAPADIGALARRVAPVALLAAVAVAVAFLEHDQVKVLADAMRRVVDLRPAWAIAAVGFECLSLAGYVGLLALVAGRATPRVRTRESAQITLAGAAATRLLPTAGAGGAALTVWALRRAGLTRAAALRTLLGFFVILYSAFLASIALAGAALSLDVVGNHGPTALSLVACVVATLGIAACLALAYVADGKRRAEAPAGGDRRSRLRSALRLLGLAVRDALAVVRSGDLRLVGAIAYWLFDAAVLWAMLHAFGSPPIIPVVALAYLLGQVANTVPLPGTVSGGMAGVLIAFGVPVALALPSVLAYRTIAVWLPTPPALTAIPALRATIGRWAREDKAALVPSSGVLAMSAGVSSR